MSKGRPGFMLYFDDLESLFDILDDADLGKWLYAVTRFSRERVDCLSEDESPELLTAYRLFRPKLLADAERYVDKVTSTRYAAYCKREKDKGKDPLPKEEWLDQHK